MVATGAAAVAGARYIKNKKESTYDDNYDDENNDLGDDNSDYSYSDTSSNYDSDSYMSDDYLGPAGSSYTDTNLYIFDTNTQIITNISNGLNGSKGLFTKSYEVDNQLIISLFVDSKHNVDYKVDFDNQKLVPVKTEISF